MKSPHDTYVPLYIQVHIRSLARPYTLREAPQTLSTTTAAAAAFLAKLGELSRERLPSNEPTQLEEEINRIPF